MIGNWILLGIWIVIVLWISYISLKARSETKTTTDTEPNKLYVGNNETLSAAKRNTLVDKSLAWAKTFSCDKSFSCATSGRLTEYTWTTTDCWGTYKPSDFTNCFYAVRKFGWSSALNAFHAVRPASKDSINTRCSAPAFTVSMNYLCWQ